MGRFHKSFHGHAYMTEKGQRFVASVSFAPNQKCPHSAETRDCNAHTCPADCQVATFGAWTTCTKSCGTGAQSRSRTHTQPTYGGAACPHEAETRSCNTHACPLDCSVGAFSAWTTCSMSCGNATAAQRADIDDRSFMGILQSTK